METGKVLTAQELIQQSLSCLKYTRKRMAHFDKSTHEIDSLIERLESYSNQTQPSVPLDWEKEFKEFLQGEHYGTVRISKTINWFKENVLSKVSDVAMKALESLTPGGSEFVNDVDACVAFIKEERESLKKFIVNSKKPVTETIEVWKEIDVKDELPTTQGRYFVRRQNDSIGTSVWWGGTKEFTQQELVKTWLKKVSISIPVSGGEVEYEKIKQENEKLWSTLKLIQKMYPDKINNLISSMEDLTKNKI